MPTHTIKVTGVSDELLRLLDDRIRSRHVSGRAEYIRQLIQSDIIGAEERKKSAAPTLRELFAPVREEIRSLHVTDTELGELLEEARQEAYEQRKAAIG